MLKKKHVFGVWHKVPTMKDSVIKCLLGCPVQCSKCDAIPYRGIQHICYVWIQLETRSRALTGVVHFFSFFFAVSAPAILNNFFFYLNMDLFGLLHNHLQFSAKVFVPLHARLTESLLLPSWFLSSAPLPLLQWEEFIPSSRLKLRSQWTSGERTSS